jgi:acetylornithine/N-succinyldiaminopimelate aminotransferase
LNTLSVTRGVDNTSRYIPVLPGTRFVPHGDSAAVAAVIDDNTAAVIVEPIQGEGGVQIPASAWLAEVQALCRQHGALLIVDEIQTGFCRTGKFFALEHSPTPIEPNIMTLGKGIAGGFPFAAFAVSASVASRLGKDDHGGTYCGNPLGCAVARDVVAYLRDHDVARRAAASGVILLDGLGALQRQFPALIREVRGLGLLCALEFHEHAHSRQVTRLCSDRGLLVVPTRNGIVRLLPDLLVAEADIAAALTVLRGVLAEL